MDAKNGIILGDQKFHRNDRYAFLSFLKVYVIAEVHEWV
jgi:hypothetical protein